MERQYRIEDLDAALQSFSNPTIILFARIEGRPRAENFDRSLKGEVRDALWMLTRQYQMGRFRGADAGSPALAKVHMDTTPLRHYRPNGRAPEPFPENVPMEAQVEHRPIPFVVNGKTMSIDIRLLMGRRWLKLIHDLGAGYERAYIERYRYALPDPSRPEDGEVCAHVDVWQRLAAIAGQCMDGWLLYTYLKGGSNRHAYDGLSIGLSKGDKAAIDGLAQEFIDWFERLFYQPESAEQDAWNAQRLEYQFECDAPGPRGGKRFVAEEYYHGHLDWYSVDLQRQALLRPDPDRTPMPHAFGGITRTLIPAPIVFEGMPNARWWAFEDQKTNFGQVSPDITDLGKLLLIDFALLYANDWFLVPFAVPIPTVGNMRGIVVTNVFGERLWVEAADHGPNRSWQRWSLFRLGERGGVGEDTERTSLFLPTLPSRQDSRPLEEVVLVRDEVSNMVWGIEVTIPLATGIGRRGSEAARELGSFYASLLQTSGTVPTHPSAAPLRYQVMNSVPENWIPFIPVHVQGSNREIQLQRAGMPRINPPRGLSTKVQPRTSLLREGLDETPASVYYVHEEEIPRAGIRLKQAFHRTRWRDGRPFVWLGVRKETGRGEGASGLAFDQIVHTESAKP